MLTDNEIKTNAAVVKKLMMISTAESEHEALGAIIDTVTSMILCFHRIARCDFFEPMPQMIDPGPSEPRELT